MPTWWEQLKINIQYTQAWHETFYIAFTLMILEWINFGFALLHFIGRTSAAHRLYKTLTIIPIDMDMNKAFLLFGIATFKGNGLRLELYIFK